MALIKNASNILTKGINEVYGVAADTIKGGVGAGVKKAVKDTAIGALVPGGVLGKASNDGGGNSGGGSVVNPNQYSQPAGPNKPTSLVKTTGGGGGGSSKSGGSSIDNAANDQQDAAKAAAEEARQAARGAYQAKVGAANAAKGTAEANYNWIIDTLGSNKKDLLDTVAMNETQGVQDFTTQESKTRENYDSAKREILTTYRDLGKEQEKILRGSGMSASSRSTEASLRLNNLLGKDLSGVSKNEADSLALIGTALTNFKQKVQNQKDSIEREVSGKLDKASIDYRTQLDAINQNLMLSENEKADAYAAAETKLAQDTAAISSWASGLKLQAEQTTAALKNNLDGFITDMTDSKKLLGADLGTKQDATNKALSDAGYTPLQQNDANIQNNGVGVYQKASKKYASADEIDKAVQNGEISTSEAQSALAALQRGGASILPNVGGSSAMAMLPKNKSLNDPLFQALLG